MPIRDFPFLSITPDNQPRPWLPIKVVNPHAGKDIFTYGLIDIGADDCSMPSFYASQLGHDFNKGTPKNINTAGGITTAYSHTTAIDIFGKDLKTVTCNIPDTLIDFTDGLQVVLLGVKNFLDHFTLEINYPRQTFSIKRKRV